jgi:hypothetical protein
VPFAEHLPARTSSLASTVASPPDGRCESSECIDSMHIHHNDTASMADDRSMAHYVDRKRNHIQYIYQARTSSLASTVASPPDGRCESSECIDPMHIDHNDAASIADDRSIAHYGSRKRCHSQYSYWPELAHSHRPLHRLQMDAANRLSALIRCI